jgi:hypothetical protein
MTERGGMLWTTEEVDQLKTEINQGMQLEDICQLHGRTPYAIIGRLQSLGILYSIGRNYHLVNPDPWVLGTEIHRLQKGDAK